MSRYFRYSIGMMFIYSILSTLIMLSGIGLSKEHLKLLFTFLSYTILFIGLIKHKAIYTTSFLEFDKVLIGILIFWFLFNILRSIQIPISNFNAFPRFLGGSLYASAFLVPLFVYVGGNLSIINMVWELAKKFYIIFLILSPFLFTVHAVDSLILVGFLPFLFLNQDKLTKLEMLFVNISFIICLVFFMLSGHRNNFVELAYYFLVASIMGNRNKFKNVMNLRFFGVVLMLLFVSGFLYLYSGNLSKHFTNRDAKENMESFEEGNLNADSRDMVFTDFASDFSNWKDILFGRGVLGTTFSPRFIKIQELTNTTNNVFNLPVGHRFEIESGYLQIVLKAGLIGLILFTVVGFRAIFLGFFRTKNTITKICALIVAERFLAMIAYGIPEYSLDYILYWLCVGACLSTKMRNITNIFFFLNFKYFKHRDLLIHKLSEDKYKLT